MASRIGKQKVSRDQYAIYASKLDVSGGTVEGDLSIAGDIDILNTISASSGHIIVEGDILFQTQNGIQTTNILSTSDVGGTLGLYNNLVYIDGTNLGIGTVTPSGKLEVAGTVVLSNLPTTEPSITGSLWVSGSTADGSSQLLAIFTGK